MGVDFNGLRLGMQDNFNAIVAMLIECSEGDSIQMDDFEAGAIQAELREFRDRLVTLMCIYTDDSNNIADQADLLVVDLIEE